MIRGLLASANPGISSSLVEIVQFLDANVMRTESVCNRNFFPVAVAVDARGEHFLPTVPDPTRKIDYAFAFIEEYARRGKIVASAVALLAHTQPDRNGETSNCVLLILDDMSGWRLTYHRAFFLAGTEYQFRDPVVMRQGPSPFFRAAH